jgi:superoxide oxidase
VIVRIGARLKYPAPADPAGTGLTRLLSKAGHLALYLLMIAMPLAGWVILSAEGKAVPFFGLELPPLVTENKDLAGQVEDLHKLRGTIGYWLIGLHALAALAHHHLLKDGTMKRMLPGRD